MRRLVDPHDNGVSLRRVLDEMMQEPHLLTFDSIHGRFDHDATGAGETLTIDGTPLAFSGIPDPGAVPWDEHGIDVVLECTGRFRTRETLAGYFERGLNPWDHAVGVLIATEAGALTGGRPGDPASTELTVAAPSGLFEPLQQLLEELGAWHD